MKKLIMLKLGGAILTYKAKPCTIQMDMMDTLVRQIYNYLVDYPGSLIIGNGGGSFGHYYAERYKLVQGYHDKEGQLGMCKGKNSNALLHTLFVEKLTNYGVSACSFSVDEIYFTGGKKEASEDIVRWKRLCTYLDNNIIPVVYGDFLYDRERGCTIVSTEDIFLALETAIMKNPSCGYQISKILFVTDRDGVEDSDGKIIPQIDIKHFQKWEIFNPSIGFDVTGGMYGKVQMVLDMDEGMGCPVQIINGKFPERVYKALKGEKVRGTIINS